MSDRQTTLVTAPQPPLQMGGVLQRKCDCGQHTVAGGSCSECNKKKTTLQRKASSNGPANEVPPIVHQVLGSPGQPLDAATRAMMEPRFGYDFSRVRVHTDSRAAESAQAVNALAYTVGQQVVFGARQYDPNSHTGRRVLAHELTHVIQQGARGTGLQEKLSVGTAGDASEREADRIADAVVGGQSVRSISQGVGSPGSVIQRLEGAEVSDSEASNPTLWEVTKQCVKDIGIPMLIGRIGVILSCLAGFAAGPEAAPVVWLCLKLTGLVLTITQVVALLTCIGARYFGHTQPAIASVPSANSSEAEGVA